MDTNTQRENEDRVAEEYLSSLSDLNCNSKPLINMLTMLAEENIEFAGIIVKVVEQHIAKVPAEFKLPILYLIDSIVKNVKSSYVQLFSQCIVNLFCGVFEKVNEKIRERMYALRQTWNEVFAAQKLYALDVKVKRLDNNWPITAKQPSIHVNPNFLKTVSSAQAIPTEMEKILQDKTRELLELKKRKLELELEATKKHLEEQEKQFSKTAEGVIPPVEALVAAGALPAVGVRGPAIPPPIMPPGIMPPNYMGGHQNIGMRPNMFHHNVRVFRPNLHPNVMNVPPQGMTTSVMPSASVGANKPKVHPVNPALLNSVRQRDPRLQRQQQQQQQQQQQMQQQKQNERNSGQQSNRSLHMEKEKNERNLKISHKSPTRSSSSTGRSSKSSQRDKDRDRKRSESKSSTALGSTAGSMTANTERKKAFSSSSKTSDKHSSSAKCDKDAFEIAPLSTAFKRKSSSPISSPSKSRDAKRYNSHKSRNSSRSKTRSRSRSPASGSGGVGVGGSNTKTLYKDVDLRRNSNSSTASSMITSPDKRPKISDSSHDTKVDVNKSDKEDLKLKGLVTTNISSDKDLDKTMPVTEPVTGLMDIDLRPHFVVASPSSVSTEGSTIHAQTYSSSSSNKQSLDLNSKFTPTTNVMTPTPTNKSNFFINIDEDNILSTTGAKNIVVTSSPKVSFKIQKIFNKLEQSTENILSAATSSSGTATGSSSHLNMDTVMDSKALVTSEESGQVSKEQDDDGKKRPLASIEEEEPLAKKSKSAKLDPLFGSEDVDLRQLIPPVIAPNSSQEETAPPPPPINISANIATESDENWNIVKTDNNKNTTTKAKSSLEDVRAKLAKTAKFNKISKLEKLKKDIDHRNKLGELQMNDDSLEANDEKIRTMITQAQELLETNSINREQYKNLVKTVMALNEDTKLKEAKRRESLTIMKQKNNDEESNDSTERNAAVQAVLKKRIPKLNKTQTATEQIMDGGNLQQSDVVGGSGNAENSPRSEDKPDSNDEQHNSRMNRNIREKRGSKMAKWGERALEAPPGALMPTGLPGQQQQQQQRPWNSMTGPNNRSGFRGNAAQNVRPPWAMGPAGGNVNGPAPPPPQFVGGIVPIGGHMHGNILPPHIGLPPQVIPPPPQPPVIPKPCNSIDNPQEDLVRTITIDGAAKEIRFYDQVAIVFMEVDQPREIGFQNGQRNISIDNNEPIILQFNDDYKTVTVDGELYKLRFGFPSRELYIDENWYEIYFGGPPISVPIRNKMHMLKAEGPPPQVNIGPLRRDLVVGKINMIVDAHNVIPVFLDARPQIFRLGDKDHTIQFADRLLTVLLDGAPTRVEYGGLPKSLFLGGKKYFVRFGALPQGVVAGKVHIKDMIYVETSPPHVADTSENEAATTEEVPPPPPSGTVVPSDVNQVELPKTSPQSGSIPILPAASLTNINIDELFQKLVSTGILGGGSASSGGVLPAINSTQPSATSTVADGKTNETEKSVVVAVVGATESNTAEELPPPAPLEAIKPIDLSKSESIKTRQAAIVATLFTGMQCSSCGVRFPPEQTIKYSQHLDWHFRQNRRERDTSRKAHARKWYYDLNDWVQYEEIEDMEERDKNFFDQQSTDLETMDETSNQRSTNSPIPTCPAGADDVDRECDMCQEKFEQFYNNELEEWHLRSAIRVEDKIYHPLCYEDYKASLNPPAPKPSEEESSSADKEISLIQIDDDNAVDIVIKVEDDDKNSDSANIIEDDDDDVIVLPNEEPSVTEIVDDDDDEYIPANVTREQMGHIEDDEDGQHNETNESDVEIQEPNIPFTDLDTYVEKELPEGDDNSQLSFMRLKIKEEPKEDDDEDDGFEEVGTVVIAPEEISINSSEETQTQTIDSSTSAMSPVPIERPASRTSLLNEEHEATMDPPTTDLNISMDGNLETGDEHNLSAAGPAPTVPLASLVNKIKINISKNIVTTSSNTNSSNSATISSSSALNSTKSNQNDSLGHSVGGVASNPIPTISTIPVLCGGGTTISSISSSIQQGGSSGGNVIGGYDDNNVDNSVSTISVIGSYGSTAPTITHISRPVTAPTIQIAPKAATPPPPQPIEETITYELKPALQKANLRKKEKVVCGNETSGLCSIM